MRDPIDPRVADWLRSEAPTSVDRTVVDAIMRDVRATPQRAPWILRLQWFATPLVAAAATAAVILSLVLLMPFVSPPTGGPDSDETWGPSAPPTTTSSPRPSVSATPAPRSSATTLEMWPIAPMPNPAPNAYIGGIPHDAVAGGPGYVAIGASTPCCADVPFDPEAYRAVVWTSEDGTSWKLVSDLDSFGPTGLFAIAANADGVLVALGHDYRAVPPDDVPPNAGLAWTSRNGLDWSPVSSPDGSFQDVVASRDEWLLGGSVDGRPAVFSSTDLTTWTTETLDSPGTVTHLASGGGRTLAIACGVEEPTDRELTGGCVATPWVRHDRGGWERGELAAWSPGAIAYWEGRFVVTALAPDVGGAGSWTSTDGLEWIGGNLWPDRSAIVHELLVADSTLVAAGSAPSGGHHQASVWQSTDGATWEPLAALERADGQIDGEVRALISTATGIVAVGDAFFTSGGPYMWTSGD